MRVTDDADEIEDDGEEAALLAKFGKWDKALEAKWSPWLEENRICYAAVAGDQWDKADRDAMIDEGRQPVVFNRMAPTLDSVSGAEVQGRQRVQYTPRQVGSSAVNDVLTQGAEYIRNESDASDEESDAFRDVLICGAGWTNTRPLPTYQPPHGTPEDALIDPQWLDTQIPVDRIDPLTILADPASRKPCFADARYLRREEVMSRDEFEEMWPGEEEASGESEGELKRATIVDPKIRYTNGTNGDDDESDEVTVKEYQWFEQVPVHITAIDGKMHQLPADTFDELKSQTPGLHSVKIMRKIYRRAFVCGDTLLMVEDLECQDFTYKAMTGKRDRNKGTWYGLVRPMMDPQQFANKFFSQILHIINSNAKGGMAIEEGAVEDIRQFEDSWSSSDKLTVLKDGSLSNANGPRMLPKQPPAYPQGSDRLMQVSIEGIRDVTGVNQEMLGLADRDQPGVLEYQRKQAAHGILAVFFDSKRRYHKMQGRLQLKLMALYMPPDKLVRIVGKDGSPEYVKLALEPDTMKYDVIVDEAPDGPNQKMQTFQVLVQLLPLLSQAELPMEFWAELARMSPLPAALASKISQMLMAKQQQEQAQAPQEQAKADAAFQADVGEKQASAQLKTAQAQAALAKANEQPQANPIEDAARVAQIHLDHARTAEIQANIVEKLLTPQHEEEPSPNE